MVFISFFETTRGLEYSERHRRDGPGPGAAESLSVTRSCPGALGAENEPPASTREDTRGHAGIANPTWHRRRARRTRRSSRVGRGRGGLRPQKAGGGRAARSGGRWGRRGTRGGRLEGAGGALSTRVLGAQVCSVRDDSSRCVSTRCWLLRTQGALRRRKRRFLKRAHRPRSETRKAADPARPGTALPARRSLQVRRSEAGVLTAPALPPLTDPDGRTQVAVTR